MHIKRILFLIPLSYILSLPSWFIANKYFDTKISTAIFYGFFFAFLVILYENLSKSRIYQNIKKSIKEDFEKYAYNFIKKRPPQLKTVRNEIEAIKPFYKCRYIHSITQSYGTFYQTKLDSLRIIHGTIFRIILGVIIGFFLVLYKLYIDSKEFSIIFSPPGIIAIIFITTSIPLLLTFQSIFDNIREKIIMVHLDFVSYIDALSNGNLSHINYFCQRILHEWQND